MVLADHTHSSIVLMGLRCWHRLRPMAALLLTTNTLSHCCSISPPRYPDPYAAACRVTDIYFLSQLALLADHAPAALVTVLH